MTTRSFVSRRQSFATSPAAALRLCALAAAAAFPAFAQLAPQVAAPTPTAESSPTHSQAAPEKAQPAPAQQLPAQQAPAPAEPGAAAAQPAASATAAKPAGVTLPELVARARQRDPRAEVAHAQVQRAQGKRDEVAWAWFPAFESSLGFGGPTPEARLVGGDKDPNLTDITPGTANGWGQLGVAFRAQTTAVVPIWTFGKLSNGKSAAEHGVGFAQAMLRRAQDQAAFDVTRAFWGWQTAHAGVSSIQSTRKRLDDAQKTAKRLLKENSEQLSKTDSLKLDYLKEEIEAQYAGALKAERLAMAGIRALVGAAPDEALDVARRDLPTPPELPDAQRAMQQAQEQRPESAAAREGVLARERLVDVERARLYPDLAVIGGATYTETTNASNPNTPFANNPYHERSAYIALGLKATFDIPQKLARLKQAEADLREAQALARGAQALIRVEVEQALGELQEARTRHERYAKEAQIGKQLAIKASIAFDSGLGEARELLEDTLLFARADGERLKALFDAQLAWASLQKAMGVGP